MAKKYPPLSVREVQSILRAWGFRHVRTRSSHEQWLGKVGELDRLVTVDTKYAQFDEKIVGLMIGQSGLSREEFYCATKTTARKINKDAIKPVVR